MLPASTCSRDGMMNNNNEASLLEGLHMYGRHTAALDTEKNVFDFA